jgi:hypothetical protein
MRQMMKTSRVPFPRGPSQACRRECRRSKPIRENPEKIYYHEAHEELEEETAYGFQTDQKQILQKENNLFSELSLRYLSDIRRQALLSTAFHEYALDILQDIVQRNLRGRFDALLNVPMIRVGDDVLMVRGVVPP